MEQTARFYVPDRMPHGYVSRCIIGTMMYGYPVIVDLVDNEFKAAYIRLVDREEPLDDLVIRDIYTDYFERNRTCKATYNGISYPVQLFGHYLIDDDPKWAVTDYEEMKSAEISEDALLEVLSSA